jgi:NAD-dependent deacetylase
MRCTRCRERRSARAPIDATSTDTLPRCSCGALLRPDVVWFGESLDDGVIAEAFRLAAEADLCLVIGTSGVVQPAASLAGVTLANGGVVVEVNPDQTPLSASASFSIRGTAVGVVPGLVGDSGQGGERPLR